MKFRSLALSLRVFNLRKISNAGEDNEVSQSSVFCIYPSSGAVVNLFVGTLTSFG